VVLDRVGTADGTAAADSYVIADRQTDRFVGILGLGRRAADRPGYVTGNGGELELSYVPRRAPGASGWRSRRRRDRSQLRLCRSG